VELIEIQYILESNPHPFYSFRGLKGQMRIRIECGLDSRSRAGEMIEPVYVLYEQYRAAKTRCGLDSRIYGTYIFSCTLNIISQVSNRMTKMFGHIHAILRLSDTSTDVFYFCGEYPVALLIRILPKHTHDRN
jgi:hypothetical protein